MRELDVLLRGGTIVTAAELLSADLGIANGKIVALAPNLDSSSREIIDVPGLHIFPGVIDAHVHFNEPGRAEWEGIETGSRALAAGGGTLFFDMPLNAHPPTTDAASFDQKLAAARASSLTDFAFWGGLVPGNVDNLEELSGRGVVGFKAFMANSGIDDFQSVDDNTLREGMKRAAKLKKIVAVHAESEVMTRDLSQQLQHQGRTHGQDEQHTVEPGARNHLQIGPRRQSKPLGDPITGSVAGFASHRIRMRSVVRAKPLPRMLPCKFQGPSRLRLGP